MAAADTLVGMDIPPQIYLSDVTDAEWAVREPLVTPATRRGRPRLHPVRRRILTAIVSLVRSGGAWRLLPLVQVWLGAARFPRAAKTVGRGAQCRLARPSRRLSNDYERLCTTSEALIYVRMIRLMLRRLTRR